MHKPSIALVTGGLSGEAQISYRSAKTIEANLSKERYDVHWVDIRKDGWWYRLNETTELPIDKNDFSVELPDTSRLHFDAVLIGMHGTPGEDGRLQGYFDMIGMPYTGCGAISSAVTFNKRYAVAVAGLSGIKVAKSLHYFNTDTIDLQLISNELEFPIFIKPANGGSSIGMSKLADENGLAEALQKAFAEDDQVLIEEFIAGREFTVGVVQWGQELVVLPITEVSSHNFFFDFEAKYQGKSSEVTPAIMDAIWQEQIETSAKKIYQIFNCKGVVRIDFIYNEKEGAPYMLEVNTIPGQSAASVVPQQIAAMGKQLSELYETLVDSCLKS